MAKSDLIGEVYGNLSNSMDRLSSQLDNSADRIQRVRETADRSTLNQLLVYQDSIYSNIDIDNPDNDGYLQKLSRTYDQAEFTRLEADSLQLMYAKMDELGVNQRVRKMWEDEYMPAFRQKLNQAKGAAYLQNYVSTTAQKWGSFVETISSNSDLNFTQKREKLEAYWKEVGLDNITTYKPDLLTVDQAMEDMQAGCITQLIDRYYALGPSQNENPTSIADFAMNSLKAQLPEDKPLDADTEFALKQLAMKQANAHETELQSRANDEILKMGNELVNMILVEKKTPTADTVLEIAASHGAYNPDGTINRYWTSYLSGFESLVNAQMKAEEERDQAIAAAQADVDLWGKVNALTADDWTNLAVELSMTDAQRMGAEEATGEVSIANLKDSKTKTYTFGIKDEETSYWTLAQTMAERLGITDKTSDQFREILRQANAVGSYYELLEKHRNGELKAAIDEGQYDDVLSTPTSEWQTVLNNVAGDANFQYLREMGSDTGSGPESYVWENAKGNATYTFTDENGNTIDTITTEWAPMVDEMARQKGITDRNSEQFRLLVRQANMYGADGFFSEPAAKTEAELTVEQINAVSSIGEGFAVRTVQEILSHEPVLGSTTMSQTGAARTPENASVPKVESTPGSFEFRPPQPASSAQTEAEVQTEETTVEQGATLEDYTGLLGQFIDENGHFMVSSLTGDKTYEFSDGTSVPTRYAPIVERMRAALEQEHGKLTDPALKALVNKVNEMGETTYLFCDGAEEREVQRLRGIMVNTSISDDNKRLAVVSSIATSRISESRAKDEGFLKDQSPWSKTDESYRNRWLTNLENNLSVAYLSVSKNRKEAESGKSNVKAGYTAKWNRLLQDAQDMLEVEFNMNPEGFIGNEDRIIQEVVANVYNTQLSDDVKAAYSMVSKAGSGLSERTSLQALMDGVYNPRWRINDDGTRDYINYTPYLDPAVVDQVAITLNAAQGNTNFSWDTINWNEIRNDAANALGYNYDQLPDMDKTSVDLAICKYMYEMDFERTTKERFNLDGGVVVIIDGRGPCLIDPDSNRLYMSDADTSTSDRYDVAELTDEQVNMALLTARTGNLLSGSFVDADQWKWEGTSYKTIMGQEESPGWWEVPRTVRQH